VNIISSFSYYFRQFVQNLIKTYFISRFANNTANS
jgi:hypothetical protein